MKIVLLGANGRTGREVMRLALEAGDTVTGLVRSAGSLGGLQHERLQVHVGDVCNSDSCDRFCRVMTPSFLRWGPVLQRSLPA